MKIKKKKGFTLVELLAVIVILGILLTIGVFTANKIIYSSNKDAFYSSVSLLVDDLSKNVLLNDSQMCLYDYSKDENNKSELIDKMYVLVHIENEKKIYSVYASSKKIDDLYIDTYDMSKTTKNTDTWKVEEITDLNDSYTTYISQLMTTNTNELIKFEFCKKGE